MDLFITYGHSMFAHRFTRQYLDPFFPPSAPQDFKRREVLIKNTALVLAKYFSESQLEKECDLFDNNPLRKKSWLEPVAVGLEKVIIHIQKGMRRVNKISEIEEEILELESQARLTNFDKYQMALQHTEAIGVVDYYVTDYRNELLALIDQKYKREREDRPWENNAEEEARLRRIVNTRTAWVGEWSRHVYATALMGVPEETGYYTERELKQLTTFEIDQLFPGSIAEIARAKEESPCQQDLLNVLAGKEVIKPTVRLLALTYSEDKAEKHSSPPKERGQK